MTRAVVIVPLDAAEPEQDELRVRMEEWERWSGDGVDMLRSSASIWGSLRREMRRTDQPPLPIIAIEAGFTDETRKRMPQDQWMLLVAYYLRSCSGVRGLAQMLGISKSQAHARLVQAQAAFKAARRVVIADAWATRKAYQSTTQGQNCPEYAIAKVQDRSAKAPGPVTITARK